MKPQRRRDERIKTGREAASLDMDLDVPALVRLKDTSRSGLGLLTTLPLAPGTVVGLRIRTSQGEWTEKSARVRWSAPASAPGSIPDDLQVVTPAGMLRACGLEYV